MHCHESVDASDYIKYPIAFANKAFSTAMTLIDVNYGNYGTWVTPVDNTKFLSGIGANYQGDTSILFNAIAIGF